MQPQQPIKPNSHETGGTEAQRMLLRFQQRFFELRQALYGLAPEAVAERSGALFTPGQDGHGLFRLSLWGRMAQLTYPEYDVSRISTADGQAESASPLESAFLLYYFATADGTPLENRWIAFSELADGRFYTQAFEGYTAKELARCFGEDLSAFEQAAGALAGRRIPLGDAGFSFEALPHVPLAAVFWRGDEDFPSTCSLLFDASVNHYLPTDACAVLGSTFTRMLIKARG